MVYERFWKKCLSAGHTGKHFLNFCSQKFFTQKSKWIKIYSEMPFSCQIHITNRWKKFPFYFSIMFLVTGTITLIAHIIRTSSAIYQMCQDDFSLIVCLFENLNDIRGRRLILTQIFFPNENVSCLTTKVSIFSFHCKQIKYSS